MSLDFHLITRNRPDTQAFERALTEAAKRPVTIDGDFGDPDDYLNVSAGDSHWIEVDPPGHVELEDLLALIPSTAVPPEPDAEGCLWYATASVPVAFAETSAHVIWQAFLRLADEFQGIAIDPQRHH